MYVVYNSMSLCCISGSLIDALHRHAFVLCYFTALKCCVVGERVLLYTLMLAYVFFVYSLCVAINARCGCQRAYNEGASMGRVLLSLWLCAPRKLAIPLYSYCQEEKTNIRSSSKKERGRGFWVFWIFIL